MPSTTSLQCFSAAARHLNFTLAADDLHVTQSAISRQIRNLEESLGTPLFHRLKTGLQLTQQGETLLDKTNNILTLIQDATTEISINKTESELSIATHPTFGARWLVPKLTDFMLQHPHIQINISTRLDTENLKQDRFDLAILYGNGQWQGFISDLLLEESLSLFCSPAVFNKAPSPITVDWLRTQSLLKCTTRPDSWHNWFQTAGLKLNDKDINGARFEHMHMLIQAAISGLGFAVLPEFLIEDEIASGKLISPMDILYRSKNAYFAIYKENGKNKNSLMLLRNWLFDTNH